MPEVSDTAPRPVGRFRPMARHAMVVIGLGAAGVVAVLACGDFFGPPTQPAFARAHSAGG